jgi:hypothetical protein
MTNTQEPASKIQKRSKPQAGKPEKWLQRELVFGAWCLFGCCILMFGALSALAYPPAPDHMFYGTVRDEFGETIDVGGATVFIVSTNGAGATALVAASTQPGINYRLIVPMDSARSLKTDPVWDGSLRQSQTFQLKVQIGASTYLPIEMMIFRSLGEPAGTTRLDLTLGVDSDGDGLPDAWESANGLNPNDPSDANDDADGDGTSNLEEYRAGTFAFDPNDGFRLTLVELNDGDTTLEFLAIRGRTYTVQASLNLRQWTQVNFRVVTGGLPGTLQDSYSASEVQNLRIEVPAQAGATNRYFRAIVQ